MTGSCDWLLTASAHSALSTFSPTCRPASIASSTQLILLWEHLFLSQHIMSTRQAFGVDVDAEIDADPHSDAEDDNRLIGPTVQRIYKQ